MKVFEMAEKMGHEKIVFCHDPKVQLKAIIAVHDTTLGPALGGSRIWNYKNEDEALFDVLRLSRGMTYKAAITGLNLGGGKAVIIGDVNLIKNEEFFRSFGRFVQSLNGLYITAEDVNVTVEDMNHVGKETQYVTGLSTSHGGSGDPSPFTALGIFMGIKAAVKYKLHKESLRGLKIAIQGCGAVGSNLCKLLAEEGCELFISDIHEKNVKEIVKAYGAKAVEPSAIHKTPVDVFSPCALGGILNETSIKELRTTVVAGGANNQLLDEVKDGQLIRERGILFAPDYVINAGGLINVSHELKGYNQEASKKEVLKIYNTLLNVFEVADKQNMTTNNASNLIAEKRILEEKTRQGGKLFQKTYDNQPWIKIAKHQEKKLSVSSF